MRYKIALPILLVVGIGTGGMASCQDPAMMEELFSARQEVQGLRSDLAGIADKLSFTKELTKETETFTEVLASLVNMNLTDAQYDIVTPHIEAAYRHQARMSTSRGDTSEYRDAEDDFQEALNWVIYWRDKFRVSQAPSVG